MAYSSSEVKSGILITAAIALLIFLTFRVGDFSKGKTVLRKIQFGYVSGLKENAPVHFAGHEVGRVSKIETVPGKEKPILVTLKLPEGVELHEDSRAFIDILGLMGEKFVELTPGSPESPFLNPEAVIPSEDPVRMYLLIQKMDRIADQMDAMSASLEPLFRTHQEDISKIIGNFQETSANLRDMSSELKSHPWKLIRKR